MATSSCRSVCRQVMSCSRPKDWIEKLSEAWFKSRYHSSHDRIEGSTIKGFIGIGQYRITVFVKKAGIVIFVPLFVIVPLPSKELQLQQQIMLVAISNKARPEISHWINWFHTSYRTTDEFRTNFEDRAPKVPLRISIYESVWTP